MVEPLLVARGAVDSFIRPEMANRHGLISGATGTGKTVTLHTLAEKFSAIGVPVIMADVKGDLAGIVKPGGDNPKVAERIVELKLAETGFLYRPYPVAFWDVYGEQGHPLRTTISEIGPLILSRLLNLNDTQTGVLHLVFKWADDNGLLLLDLKDLRSALMWIGEHRAEVTTEYGNVSPQSVGAIQRNLLQLESGGSEALFGEPSLRLPDLMRVDSDGRGMINIIASDRLLLDPALYAMFLLYMLAELFETLPEVGDADKPKLIFFFDEAHLLFRDAPKPLVDKIEQVVRLIRSKGVGIFFVTQSPLDLPDIVLGQLGNRVQHALRAYTPRDQKAVRAAAETFRQNPEFDTETTLTELGTGEALVSFLDPKGAPGIVQRGYILPPESKIGPIEAVERQAVITASPMHGLYEVPIDRQSAHEMLKQRTEQRAADTLAAEQAEIAAVEEEARLRELQRVEKERQKEADRQAREHEKELERLEREFEQARKREERASSSRSKKEPETFTEELIDFAGSRQGKSIIRSILGTIAGKKGGF
jgi:DNA helicase HerA-like ATPase